MFLYLDRSVIVGNHRDSWAYGAADPSSGTAVLVEVAKALGWLRSQGRTQLVYIETLGSEN